jgi:hypothetical protein
LIGAGLMISVLNYDDIEPTASTHFNRRRFLKRKTARSAGTNESGNGFGPDQRSMWFRPIKSL